MFYIYTLFSSIILLNVSIQAAVTSRQSRAYSNPQNQQSVDVYLVVDTSNRNMNRLEFEFLKSALVNIAEVLLKGHPRITILFYGTSKMIDIVYQTNGNDSIDVIRRRVEQKQYFPSSQNASTLAMAMKEVSHHCANYCRSTNVPRVSVVFTSNLQSSVGSNEARSLEKKQAMTIIAVGIKNQFNVTLLAAIASEPTDTYVVELSSYSELLATSAIISNMISGVPRMFSLYETGFINNLTDTYNTVQIDVSERTIDSNLIIVIVAVSIDFNCSNDCATLYGSLTQPNPTRDNAVPAMFDNHHSMNPIDSKFYCFYLPKDTKRFYLSSIIKSPGIYVAYTAIPINVDIAKQNVREKEKTFH